MNAEEIERKSVFDKEVLEVMTNLMQCVHMNNLYIHKCFKEHNDKMDLEEVKNVKFGLFPDKLLETLSN